MNKLANFAAFQAGWFACVLGAANGYPWLGPPAVLFLAGVQWALWWRSWSALLLLTAAAALGYLADSLLVTAGLLAFPEKAQLGGPSPVWMVVLWPNFAAALLESLSWLDGRYVLAALLGAAGGPLAYWGGEQFGAIRLAGWPAYGAVALEWAAATPLLLATSRRLKEVSQ